MNLHLCQKAYVHMLMDENPLICSCHNITLNQILEVFPESKDKDFELTDMISKIKQQTGASTGCGSCLSKVEGITQCYALKPEIFTGR